MLSAPTDGLAEENGYVPIAPFLVSKPEVGLLLSAQALAGALEPGDEIDGSAQIRMRSSGGRNFSHGAGPENCSNLPRSGDFSLANEQKELNKN